MQAILPYVMWAVVILIVVAILVVALFGLRSLMYGKVSLLSVVIILVPVLLMGLLGLMMGSWVEAGVWATVISLGLAAVALLIAGVRSLLSF